MSIEKITLDVGEVAQLLNLSKETIYAMAREGDIPTFKARGRILFNKEQIIAFTKGEIPAPNESEKQSQ